MYFLAIGVVKTKPKFTKKKILFEKFNLIKSDNFSNSKNIFKGVRQFLKLKAHISVFLDLLKLSKYLTYMQ